MLITFLTNWNVFVGAVNGNCCFLAKCFQKCNFENFQASTEDAQLLREQLEEQSKMLLLCTDMMEQLEQSLKIHRGGRRSELSEHDALQVNQQQNRSQIIKFNQSNEEQFCTQRFASGFASSKHFEFSIDNA